MDLTYFDGVAQKTAKTIEKEYVTNFDFFTQAPDNTKDQLEIQTLEIRIREEQSRYNRELQIIQNEINDLESDYRSGESRFPSMSDYEKGQWVRKRQDLKSDIAKLYRDISRKIPPSLEADLIELQGLKSREQKENVLLNANAVIVDHDKWKNDICPVRDININFVWPEIIAAALNSVVSEFNPHPPNPRMYSPTDVALTEAIVLFNIKSSMYYEEILKASTNVFLQSFIKRKIGYNGEILSISGML